MQLTIKFEPQINDVVMIALVADQLANLAATVDPDAAHQFRRELGYRLKRLKSVGLVDSGAIDNALPMRATSGIRGTSA
jgi:hypothetical protein